MNQNEQIVFDFYTAFQNLDAENMVTHYSDNIEFSDPAFGALKGNDAKKMWRMLCENAKDFTVEFSITNSKENKVYAHWEAKYLFSRTGRLVHNKIDASFIIQNGRIVKHTDDFNLWLWSKQAMGVSGWLLGWSGYFRTKLQKSTNKLLGKYTSKN